MQAFLEYVVKGLVPDPASVAVIAAERDGATVFEIRIPQADMGKIIGREGQTINVIRSLLQAGAVRKGLRCSVEVLDESGQGRPERPPQSARRGRDRERRR
jgi:predicted RNA-binding protein YlqC (UPF0109 family)